MTLPTEAERKQRQVAENVVFGSMHRLRRTLTALEGMVWPLPIADMSLSFFSEDLLSRLVAYLQEAESFLTSAYLIAWANTQPEDEEQSVG